MQSYRPLSSSNRESGFSRLRVSIQIPDQVKTSIKELTRPEQGTPKPLHGNNCAVPVYSY